MPKRAITQLFLDRISPPKAGRTEYWDTAQPGLCLRVSTSGAMVWSVTYRVKGNDRQVRETLGTLTAIPAVHDARKLAEASMKAARDGINPVEARKTAIERAAANTVAGAVERYLDRCERDLRPATTAGYRQLFEHDVLKIRKENGQRKYGRGSWADRPLSSINKGDVLELLDDKASGRARRRKGTIGGAVVQANRLLTRLRTFFGWCVANDLIAADPSDGVKKPGKETARDRVLGDDEIKAFWAATEVLDAKRRDAVAFGALFRLMLLTAQREGEVGGMRWGEVDLEACEWTIPGSRAKNGKQHVVHLSDLAMAVLAAVPRVDGLDLLFSGTGTTAASGFSQAKARLDKAMGAEGWVLHDLRRTATTGMARLGIAPHIADRVLNHTAGTIRGVAAIYNRFEYLDERKAALAAWGRFVDTLVHPGAGNVVEMRGRAR